MVESTKVSQANNVSKFNPYHDELGRFTNGGAGRRVSRMPKNKGQGKATRKKISDAERKKIDDEVNSRTDKIVSQLGARIGNDLAEEWRPRIQAAMKVFKTPASEAKFGEMDEPLNIGGKKFAIKMKDGKPVYLTATNVLDMVGDEIGTEAITGISDADFASGKTFRLKSQMPKSGKAKSNARFGLKDTKKMTDDEVMKEYRRLNARKQKLEAELPNISNRVAGYTETNEYGETPSIASRPYVSNKEIKARIKRNKGLTAAIKSRLKDLESEAKSRNISSLALKLTTPYQTRITGNDFSDKIIEKFNPNHDELGRFTFGSGMGAPAKNIRAVEKLAVHLRIKKDWSKVRAVDSKVRKQIVKAFNDAPQQLDKEQLKSWDETEKIINQQYDLLTKELGVKVEFVDYDPYKNAQDMFDSFRDTGVLKIMKTSVTGSHTYWSDATNDKFRAVHDAFGHLATGVGFDRHGEQAAYEAHKSMFPPSCYLALASELKGQNAYMVETGNFPDQRLVALPEKLQKLFMAEISKKMSEDEMSDKDNLFEIGGTHHASNGRNFAKRNRNLMSILGKVADVRTVSKETPTVSSVHLETAMGNQKKKKKKRVKTVSVEEIEKKKAKLKNPKGGLTQAGRDKFNRETGSNLKAGVKGAADTPEKMRRKGSFLTRFFTNPSGPMVNDKGEPTRLALSANAWGEPVPKNRSDAAKLAAKGRRLLERYENTKVKKFNPHHDELGRFTSGGAGKSSGRKTSKHPAEFARTRGLASMAVRALSGGYKTKKQKGKVEVSRFNPKTKTKTTRLVSAKPKEKLIDLATEYDALTTRTEQRKTYISPRTKSDVAKAKQVSDYMSVGVKRFKNAKHRAYASARVKQMTGGKPRPKGMSKPYRMSKKQVKSYEAVLYKMFRSGRLKYGI